MLIGVPKEIKNHEYRVGLTPGSVRELIHHGHQVLVESEAGAGIGMHDSDYRAAGAEVVSVADVFARAEMVVKVKEPQAAEIARLRAGQLLFTYLHLAPDPVQARGLLACGVSAIAYETVTDPRGALPLLAPMSEVAGRLAVQAGAHCLEMAQGGAGVLLGGVPGVAPAKVVIIGGGVVGDHAAQMASGLGADVSLFDRSLERLRHLSDKYAGRVKCVYSTVDAISLAVRDADLVIGAVRIPGATAPKLVTRVMLETMKRGARGGRCCHRSGRLFRDLSPDHPPAPDLRRMRRGALLRREHAGRSAAHLNLRPQQRNFALRGGARQQGLEARTCGRCRSRCGPQYPRWPSDLRGGSHGARSRLSATAPGLVGLTCG